MCTLKRQQKMPGTCGHISGNAYTCSAIHDALSDISSPTCCPSRVLHRIAAGMLGALCGGVRQCIVDIWNTCEQQPTCVHEIWHLRRREGLITDFEVTVGQAIAQELGRTQSQGTPGQEPKPTAPEEQPDQAIGKSTQHGESCSDCFQPFLLLHRPCSQPWQRKRAELVS